MGWNELLVHGFDQISRPRSISGEPIFSRRLLPMKKTGESAEPKVYPGFVPVDKKIDDKKMGRIPRSQGTFFCHQCFYPFSSETHIFVSPGRW